MEDLLNKIEDTIPGEMIISLREVYRELDKKQSRFQKDFPVHCIESCGECCRHYVPILTQAEALVAAYVIIRDEKEDEVLSRLNCGDTESTVCPLYNNEGPYHCSLYEGRSMVCRLFGFSCSEDKNHNLVWRACKWKEDKKEEIDATLLKSKRNDVPVMSEYGERLEECSDIEGESIYCAIPKAIWKLKMILQMTEDTPA